MDDYLGALILFLIAIFTIAFIGLHRMWIGGKPAFFSGIKREFMWCAAGGFLLAALTVYLWYVVDVILLIVGFALSSTAKTGSQRIKIMVVTVILVLFVSVVGIGYASVTQDDSNENYAYSEEEDYGGTWDDTEEEDYDDTWEDFEEEESDSQIDDTYTENDEPDYLDSSDTDDLYDEDVENDYADDVESNDVLPLSSSTYLTEDDLEGLTAEECRIARNEIYARHGRLFSDESLQDYFNSKDWYDGYIEPEDFDETMLNEYEISNRDLIVEYETDRGYR
jgi:hypothetical protein